MARKRRRLGDYEDREDRIEDGDYTITPCGRLGSKTCVGVKDGRFVGEFNSDSAARRAICERMDRDRFWPNVWHISDHGNVSPARIRCRSRRKK